MLLFSLEKLRNSILGFWQIAIGQRIFFSFVIEDIQLREASGSLSSLIFFRAIGSRNIQYANAQELNDSGVFSKFHPVQAQAIVTLATLETFIALDQKDVPIKFKEYAKKCSTTFRNLRST